MDGRYIEPRKTMWAVAEITWQDDQGTSIRVPAILEDTSHSGACVRIKRPVAVGSPITVKWHREQFLAITRNCRSEGRDFLLGVQREAGMLPPARPVTTGEAKPDEGGKEFPQSQAAVATPGGLPPTSKNPAESARQPAPALSVQSNPVIASHVASHLQQSTHILGTSRRLERKAMEPKTIFPHFWRRKQEEDAPAKSTTMEALVNKPSTPEPTPSGPRGELLGYEDIYRAAGIMSPGSGYGIHKVVEMLNSERIRDLAKDVQHSSVLMALDAAGISSDDLLTDATRRQNALTVYEGSQVKQVEDFEARKAKENSKIEEEMEKIRAHYAQRIQANLDQVAKEKDALRNWQMAMQHETQRIAEVIELCGKQPASAAKGNAMAAAAGMQGTEKPETASGNVGKSSPVRSTLGGH